MVAPSSIRGLMALKSLLLPPALSSLRYPYFFREKAASGPLEGIEETSKPKIRLDLVSTTSVIESGLHLVCSQVSKSSNSTDFAFSFSRLDLARDCKDCSPRKTNLRAEVFTLIPNTRADLRSDIPELKSNASALLICLFLCPKQGLKVAEEKHFLQSKHR